MKTVSDLYRQLSVIEDYLSQFQVNDQPNVLFVAPQMKMKDFYNYILPYVVMNEKNIANCAMTSLTKWDDQQYITDIDMLLFSKQLLWADIVVFPFTTQPIGWDWTEDTPSVYDQIRTLNPDVRIFYTVDFNFYEINDRHPLYSYMHSPEAVEAIELNMVHADAIMVNNPELLSYLQEKVKKLKVDHDVERRLNLICMPVATHEELIYENIRVGETLEVEQAHDAHPERVEQLKKKDGVIRLGMVLTRYYEDDLRAFQKELKAAKKAMGSKLEIFIWGLDPSECDNLLTGVEYVHLRPKSIIHYHRGLHNLNFDLLFIPLKKTVYNATSENLGKWIEASIMGTPVMTIDQFPYNSVIRDGKNGFILKKKADLTSRLKKLAKKKQDLVKAGQISRRLVREMFTYDHNEETAEVLREVFSVKKYAKGE